ncbi:hydrolase of the HAD superfamily [Lacticaseibacillus sharpeae JCM 1186 = DSM 20505]|uniref:Acid sugar phosphatase n=2 Tax=Lacticaseibacillus sharpeae TaxID=1626 RepID=A0A0R1ZIT1_9LACO|nr:hydrolase of the HAD superfamily [Lacticaseibacillus sharpeae JCM 1186 = DSM 20505]
MTKYKGYMIDLDGTIYRGNERIPEAKDFVERLQAAQIPFLFLTNNTTRTPQMVVDFLAEKHDIHVTTDEIYTPSMATANYISRENGGDPSNKSVYIIGEIGLKKAILNTGIQLNDYDPDYVVVGLDYDVTYHKFELATLAIKRGAMFIGTNEDTNLPNERGQVPGAGSVIALVERSTQQQAFYIGKPRRPIMDAALDVMGLDAKDCVMVGDNYNTDIKAGINSGIDQLLVYTGISTPAQVAGQAIQPTHVVNSLAEWEV